MFAIKCQIIDRRQTTVATCLAYLEDPHFLDSVTDLQLAYSDREEIAKKMAELSVRLFPTMPRAKNRADVPDEQVV